jgi:hypothetical protein
MKKKYQVLMIVIMLITVGISADETGIQLCEKIAVNKLIQLGRAEDYSILTSHEIRDEDKILFFVYELQPTGYIVITGDDDLPPVAAYSFSAGFFDEASGDILLELLKSDIRMRLGNVPNLTASMIAGRKAAWHDLDGVEIMQNRPEQWPPEGSTPTGGWLLENWTQSHPYNIFCPIDPVSGSRSIAGCPSIAMSQILHYHRTINAVNFNDEDDYYHNYAGRQYWIDNDYLQHDFLSFPQINEYLDSLQVHYTYDQPVTIEDKAALVFACGVAARQVYTSQASGTFGVDQAFDAFEKFNFTSAELIDESSPEFYERIAQNMMEALPVHFASVTPQWDSGHNFVIDGYNTDGYFHINFGWGGTYNGWYLLPDEIPYGLTVVEGAIVDIVPEEPASGFISGEITLVPAQSDSAMISLSAYNFHSSYTLFLEPDSTGSTDFIMQVPVGIYTVRAEYPGYETISCENITIEDLEIIAIDFIMEQMITPGGLEAVLDGELVILSWQHDPLRAFSHYNIYRNINSTAFTLLDTTSFIEYADQIPYPQSLTYGYYVTAAYAQNNETEPSNAVYIDYIVPITENKISNLQLISNYPNPFNPQTTILYELSETGKVIIDVINIKGQKVDTLLSEVKEAGRYNLIWNAKEYHSGIYFIRFATENEVSIRKTVLLK